MKLRLSSLDARIARVHGVGVAVHNHGRFVRVTVDVKQPFSEKKSSASSAIRFSTLSASQCSIHTSV